MFLSDDVAKRSVTPTSTKVTTQVAGGQTKTGTVYPSPAFDKQQVPTPELSCACASLLRLCLGSKIFERLTIRISQSVYLENI